MIVLVFIFVALALAMVGVRMIVWIVRLSVGGLVRLLVFAFRVMPDVWRTLRWRRTIRGFRGYA